MDVLVERCAGLDVHRDDVVATVRVPGERSPPMGSADADVPVRRLPGLTELADVAGRSRR